MTAPRLATDEEVVAARTRGTLNSADETHVYYVLDGMWVIVPRKPIVRIGGIQHHGLEWIRASGN